MAQAAGKSAVNVLISGAAGQIGYSLIPLFATGQVLGADQPINLRLLDIKPAMNALAGVVMEIEDGAYPLVNEITPTDQVDVAFKDCDYAVLVGGFPRRKGMLRKDLTAKNAPIFKSMGDSLEKYARNTCKILVVANPANSNCWICSNYAPKIPKENFAALTRLDQNRARGQLAKKLGVGVSAVQNVIIWGNHSATQVADIRYVTKNGQKAQINFDEKVEIEVPNEDESKQADKQTVLWIDHFRKTVAQRGKAIILARGLSSAMSAANASKDCMRDWVQGSNDGYLAMAVYSKENAPLAKGKVYELIQQKAPGVFFSVPVTCADGKYTVADIEGDVDDKTAALIEATAKELVEERDECKEICANLK